MKSPIIFYEFLPKFKQRRNVIDFPKSKLPVINFGFKNAPRYYSNIFHTMERISKKLDNENLIDLSKKFSPTFINHNFQKVFSR